MVLLAFSCYPPLNKIINKGIKQELEIVITIKKMTNEELLAKAKADYPIGTKYCPAHLSGVELTVTACEPKWHSEEGENIIIDKNDYESYAPLVRYINNGIEIWAKIISKPAAISYTGHYVVIIKERTRCTNYKKGEIDQVYAAKGPHLTMRRHGYSLTITPDFDDFRVFPTKEEAQKFSDELLGISTKPESVVKSEDVEFPLSQKDLIVGKWYFGKKWAKGSCLKYRSGYGDGTESLDGGGSPYKLKREYGTYWYDPGFYAEVPQSYLDEKLPKGHADRSDYKAPVVESVEPTSSQIKDFGKGHTALGDFKIGDEVYFGTERCVLVGLKDDGYGCDILIKRCHEGHSGHGYRLVLGEIVPGIDKYYWVNLSKLTPIIKSETKVEQKAEPKELTIEEQLSPEHLKDYGKGHEKLGTFKIGDKVVYNGNSATTIGATKSSVLIYYDEPKIGHEANTSHICVVGSKIKGSGHWFCDCLMLKPLYQEPSMSSYVDSTGDKFIEGAWYETSDGYRYKFESMDGPDFCYSESIKSDGVYNCDDYDHFPFSDSETYKYIPEGVIDEIIDPPHLDDNGDEFIKDRWYRYSLNDNYYKFLQIDCDGDFCYSESVIDGVHDEDSHWISWDDDYSFSLVDDDEVEENTNSENADGTVDTNGDEFIEGRWYKDKDGDYLLLDHIDIDDDLFHYSAKKRIRDNYMEESNDQCLSDYAPYTPATDKEIESFLPKEVKTEEPYEKCDSFNIGDKVKIVTLDSKRGLMPGITGHIGVITEINGDYYELEPSCTGSCWPADCFALIEKAEVKPDVKLEETKACEFIVDVEIEEPSLKPIKTSIESFIVSVDC